MEKAKLAGMSALLTLSALAVVTVYCYPITAHVGIAAPFATDRIADEATVTIADGRSLVMRGGTLSLGEKKFLLSAPRHFASLTSMPTGQVLIWGGIDDEGHLVETGEWFEPSTGALVTTGRLGLPVRAAHTLTVLSDGSLAMTGGWGPGNVLSHDVAIWRPLDRHLDLKPGGDAHARLGASAALMADGTLTISGGVDEIGRPAADAWQFGAPKTSSSATSAIAASYPTKDAAGASPIGPLALRFAHPVDVAQLSGTVSLLGPNGVVKTRVVGAEGGRLAFIQLPNELYPSARYTIFVQGLHTAKGEVVPYEAIGFTTKAARSGVVLAGEGKRPGTPEAKSDAPPLFVMAGEGKARPCKPADAFHLCRAKGLVKDGAFYPGQDNVASSSGGHWRLYKDRQTLPDTKQLEANLPKGATALIGQVRQIDETPVANVEISVDGQKVRTDARGVFVLQNLVPGHRELFVDGRPAGSAVTEYGRFVVGADVTAKTVNHMPFVMYLPRVLARDKVALPSPTTRETVLTHPDMPGLELRIPAGAVFKDRDGKVLNEIAIVPTPVDHAPFPLPDNFPMYFTIQPGDAVVQGMTPEAAKGIQVVYPNYGKQKPADKADFWVYSAEKGWEMYGAGHVSADASKLVADEDTRLVWALGAGASADKPPPTNDGPDCNQTALKPVDLQTGVFFHQWQDLKIDDVIPLSVNRTHNGLLSFDSPFGAGATDDAAMRLYSSDGFAAPEIVLGCGQVVRFDLVAGQPIWPLVGTVWSHRSTSSTFFGATLEFLNDSTPEGAHWVVSTAAGEKYLFERHAPNHLVSYQDKFGNAVRYEYQSGLLQRVVSPNGRSISYTYTTQNQVASVSDDIGRTVRYHYRGFTESTSHLPTSVLTKVDYPDGTSEAYSYDDIESDGVTIQSWKIKTMTDRRGVVWVTNEYDPNHGRIIAQSYPNGSRYSFSYEISNGVVLATELTDPLGTIRRYEFDPVSKYVSKDVRAKGTEIEQTWSYVRTPAGAIMQETDPQGRITDYSRDSMGRVTKVVRRSVDNSAPAQTETFAYDDASGLISEAVSSTGETSRAAYEGGCMVSSEGYGEALLNIECDSAGHVVLIRDALGNATQRAFEGGDLVKRIDALGRETRYTYDAVGRRTSTTAPDGTVSSVSYDEEDRVSTVTDETGHSVTLNYDGNGNVTRYDLPGGSHFEVVYDSMNHPIRRVDQDGRAEFWTYDALGRPASYTGRDAKVVTIDRDLLGRPTRITYGAGDFVSMRYDVVGRLITLHDTMDGDLYWNYDSFGRLASETSPRGTIRYTYDASGRRTSIGADDGSSVDYVYGAGGKLIAVGHASAFISIEYDKAGKQSGIVLPNGIKGTLSYDRASDIAGIVYSSASGAKLRSLQYVSQQRGQIASLVDDLGSAPLPAPSVVDSTYSKSNVLLTDDGSPVSSNAAGEIESFGSYTLHWNGRHQLVSVSDTAGLTVAQYTYDGLGRRVSKLMFSSDRTDYLVGDAGIVQSTRAGARTTYILGRDPYDVFGSYSQAGERYYLRDAAGSIVGVSDEGGSLVASRTYSPYGQSSAPLESGDVGYMGWEWDGWGYFADHRYFVPALSRFVSEDPIRFGGGQLNLYTYGDADPLNASDPSGLAPKDKWFGYDDRNFKDWYHRCVKRDGDHDVPTREEMAELWAQWLAEGRPGRCDKDKRRCRNRDVPHADPQPAPAPDESPDDSQNSVPAPDVSPVNKGIIIIIIILLGLGSNPATA